jgi:hypothetical protein
VELARKNNLSLWQMDWVWFNISTTYNYEGISNFITKTMKPQSTYQPVVIRALLVCGQATKEDLDKIIIQENPHKGNNFVSPEVYEALVDRYKLVSLEGNNYRLNLDQALTLTETKNLIELCNQEITRIKEFYNLAEKNISGTHLDILKKFYKKTGKYLRAEEIYGEKKDLGKRKLPLPPEPQTTPCRWRI